MAIEDTFSSRFLNITRENRVVVISLPYHTSYELQPLDVSVFGPYKSYLQDELNRVSSMASKPNHSTVSSHIWNVYSHA